MILVAFAYIALIIFAAYWLLRALEVFAPNVARGWFGQLAEDNEADVSRLDALDFTARDRDYFSRLDAELEQRHRAQAARRRGQDLPPVESIGDRSLDEIRRDFGGDAA